ncbi:unnamed protein product [Prunus armeniaca]|uniref:X8 domain-containing protein n=1 Tax=Prunus armeniaca TaxID=36596 RepID=A0A6J5XT45_PRUAR|nr:unnamed protein product [Prunus armeniaca]
MAKLTLPGPVISLLLLFFFSGEISMLVNGQKAWCVAKPAAPQHALQSALDYACNCADCSPTKKGGSCYDPDRPVHHASFAMNAYYQKMGRNQWNCHFNNTSLISLADPSYNPCCQFVSGGSGPPLPQEKEDTWCVPKPGTPDSALQNIINFTCGILKECSEIQEHGSCYFPNTFINHASFAMNLYYKTDGRYNCDFNGVGLIVVTNPSFGDCIYV